MKYPILLVVVTATAVCSFQAAAQAQPSTSNVACPTCKPGESAPKLASDCPLPTRRLLRGGGGHSGGGHGGGGGHSHSGGGGGHMHSGGSNFHSGGGGARSVSVNNHPVIVNNHNGNQGNQGGEHHDHDHDHQNNNNWGPNYRPGGLWWVGGGPTYVSNTNVWTPGVVGCQPYQCALNEYWSSQYCHCVLDEYEDEAEYADINLGLLGRKLLTPSSAHAADGTPIDAADAPKILSNGPEYLPAHPGRNSRLRAKLYKRVCKEGEPCRKATRSYKVKVHHENGSGR